MCLLTIIGAIFIVGVRSSMHYAPPRGGLPWPRLKSLGLATFGLQRSTSSMPCRSFCMAPECQLLQNTHHSSCDFLSASAKTNTASPIPHPMTPAHRFETLRSIPSIVHAGPPNGPMAFGSIPSSIPLLLPAPIVNPPDEQPSLTSS